MSMFLRELDYSFVENVLPMRKFVVFSCAAALLIAAASCRKEVPAETEFLPKTESVAAAAEGGTYSIEYVLNNPVEGQSVEASTEAEWISGIDCTESGSVSFTVAPNEGYESRADEILVEYGEFNFSVPVTQAAKSLPEYDYDVETECSQFQALYYGDAYGTYTHFFIMSDLELGSDGNFNPDGTYYVIYLTRNIDESTATAAFTSGVYSVDPASGYADWTISANESYVISKNVQYKITDGTLVISGDDYNESTFDLSLVLDDGTVHHAVYSGPQYGEDYSIDWITEDVDMTAMVASANFIKGEGDEDYRNANINITLYSNLDDYGWVEVPGYSLIMVGNVDFDENGNIVSGTYPISSEAMIENEFEAGFCTSFMNSPFPSGTNIRYFYVDNTQQMVGMVTSGEVRIDRNEDIYTIKADFVTREGVNVHASYTGELDIVGAPGKNPFEPFYLKDDYQIEFPLENATMVNVMGMSSTWSYENAVSWTFNFYQYNENYAYHGDQIQIEIVCPEGYTDEPQAGTYTVATAETKGTPGTVSPGTFEPGVKDNYYVNNFRPTVFRNDDNGTVIEGAAAAGGELTLTKNDDGTWTIVFDFTDQQADPKHFTFNWTGTMEIW